ncbi:hypothetical protein HDU92_002211 [Lobulomyces angularis]|nr:hypothetical protein HDU92_002211 [Lobulomyces angularis]
MRPSANETTALIERIFVEEDHHKATFNQSVFHLVCLIAGSGVLQLPFALSQVGWIGIFLIIFASSLNLYTGNLLIKCLYYNEHAKLESLSDIGVTCIYLILAGMNLSELCGNTVVFWITVSSILVFFPLVSFKNLKEISFLSFFGVFATLFVIAIVCFYSSKSILHPVDTPTYKYFDLSMIPNAMATICFSFSGNFAYAEIQSSMKKPKDFSKVLFCAMIIISLMYCLTAVSAYTAFGEKVTSPVNLMFKGFSSAVGTYLITTHVLLACPLLLISFSLEVERKFFFHLKENERLKSFTLRTIVLGGVAITASVIPYFSDFMELLGAFVGSILMFIIPVVFDWKLYGIYQNRTAKDILLNFFCFFIGGAIGALGTWRAAKNLIAHYS